AEVEVVVHWFGARSPCTSIWWSKGSSIWWSSKSPLAGCSGHRGLTVDLLAQRALLDLVVNGYTLWARRRFGGRLRRGGGGLVLKREKLVEEKSSKEMSRGEE
ncbi:hypothetical protein Dimus_014045, partial [Dionaea muscipula]